MEWFEKEYKNRFENESSLEGVESGPLWDQISKSIPQNRLNRKIAPWKLSLLGLFLLGAALSWVFLVDINENEDVRMSQTNPAIHPTDNASENKILPSNDISNKNSTLDNQILNDKENTVLNSAEHQSNLVDVDLDSTSDLGNESQNLSSNESIEKVKQINKNRTSISDSNIANATESTNSTNEDNEPRNANNSLEPNDNTTSAELTTKATTSHKDDSVQEKRAIQHNKAKSNIVETNQASAINSEIGLVEHTTSKEEYSKRVGDVTNPLETRNSIELNKLDLIQIEGLIRNENVTIPSVSPVLIKVEKKNPFAFQIQTSANFFDLQYSDDQDLELFADTANASLGSLQMGNSIGLKMDYYLNRSWSISAGIALSNFENKMNTVLMTDTIVLDTFNKLRDGRNIRTVNHHNKLSTISIPLSIAYENQLSDRWSVGSSVGVSYTIVTTQSGKLLDREKTILKYSNEENRQFTNFLSFRINPFLKYRVGENISLYLNGGLSMQSHGKAEIQGLTHSSKIYSLGIGFQYKM